MEDSSIVAVAVLAAFGLTELLLRRDAMARRLRPDVSDRGLTLEQIKNELLNGRDLSKKGSRKRQVEYAERMAEKALRSV
jgi:hypothetical protein